MASLRMSSGDPDGGVNQKAPLAPIGEARAKSHQGARPNRKSMYATVGGDGSSSRNSQLLDRRPTMRCGSFASEAGQARLQEVGAKSSTLDLLG
eukprot:5534604-Prymnesium_polylepis.2